MKLKRRWISSPAGVWPRRWWMRIGHQAFLSRNPDPALKTVSAQRADLSLALVASSAPDNLAEKFNSSPRKRPRQGHPEVHEKSHS